MHPFNMFAFVPLKLRGSFLVSPGKNKAGCPEKKRAIDVEMYFGMAGPRHLLCEATK